MKKILKAKNTKASTRAGSDVAGFMAKIQEQLVFLGSKVDALFGHISAKPSEVKEPPKTIRQADRDKFIAQPGASQRPGEEQQGRRRSRGRDHAHRNRVMHKAVCADCHKDCEIPFKPSGVRPVYCNECYSKHKSSTSPHPKSDNEQTPAADLKETAGRHENPPSPRSRGGAQGARHRDYGRSPRSRPVPATAPAPSVTPQQRPETVIKKKVGRVTVSEVVRGVPKR